MSITSVEFYFFFPLITLFVGFVGISETESSSEDSDSDSDPDSVTSAGVETGVGDGLR